MSEVDLHNMASAVFGGSCGFGVARVDFADPASLLAQEAEAIRHAVPSRAREFAAGRMAARQALGWSVPIQMAPDRAPVWPKGWAGSISHAAGWAVAVVRKGGCLVGIDLEPDDDLPADVLSDVLTPDEARRFGHDLRLARRIFAIKESVYKAQYPVSREVFDFQMLEISLSETRFLATFQDTVGPFRGGDVIAGAWSSGGGLVLAGVLS